EVSRRAGRLGGYLREAREEGVVVATTRLAGERSARVAGGVHSEGVDGNCDRAVCGGRAELAGPGGIPARVVLPEEYISVNVAGTRLAKERASSVPGKVDAGRGEGNVSIHTPAIGALRGIFVPVGAELSGPLRVAV